MARILSGIIEGLKSEFLASNPSTKEEGTRFVQTDTGTSYKIVNGKWENENPVQLSISTVSTKFMPLNEQTGLTFGDAFWTSSNAEMVGDGSMLYFVRSDAAIVSTGGYFGVNDYARPDLFPKIEIKFKVDDATSSNAVFIGLLKDSVLTATLDSTGFIPTASECIVLGAKDTDTNWMVYHNDTSGALNSEDTGIARDENIHNLTIQYTSTSQVLLSLKDIDGVEEFGLSISSQIPVSTNELQFVGGIVNTDTVARYGLYIYDHIYLEKRIPEPTGVVV